MSLLRHFRDHPASVGETYLEHARSAGSFGVSMQLGAFACFLHAIVPALCTSVGSQIIARLHNRMIVNRWMLLSRFAEEAMRVLRKFGGLYRQLR